MCECACCVCVLHPCTYLRVEPPISHSHCCLQLVKDRNTCALERFRFVCWLPLSGASPLSLVRTAFKAQLNLFPSDESVSKGPPPLMHWSAKPFSCSCSCFFLLFFSSLLVFVFFLFLYHFIFSFLLSHYYIFLSNLHHCTSFVFTLFIFFLFPSSFISGPCT